MRTPGRCSVKVEHLLHRRPPLPVVGGVNRLLAGIGELPPPLGRRVRGHRRHVGVVVVAVVLQIGEQDAVAQVDRVIADMHLVQLREHARPGVGVQRAVLRLFLRAQPDDRREALHAHRGLRGRNVSMPPSTASATPVTDPAAGEARYAIAAAPSAGDTSRPCGCRASSSARSACGSSAIPSRRPTQGVSAVPGFTALTRMPSGSRSAAIARVRAATAPLLAEYSARWGNPAVAAIEQVLTIAARDEARNAGSAARVTRTMPSTFTSST